ncbi:hypothetical protein ACHMW6_23020 [Pseudoduganella sp. UC29_106]|uniref:hypothetical protein n=1 Tax=Pseudoduganella sp. UC29_106 TaxID=3374553 RepID=UPI0037584C56
MDQGSRTSAGRAALHVSYRQDEAGSPRQGRAAEDARIRVQTEYTLEPGRIVRKDVYTPQGGQEVRRLSLEFGSFSSAGRADGNTVRFGEGDVTEFSVEGLQGCTVAATDGNDGWKAPYGAMRSVVSRTSGAFTMDKPLTVTWSLRYR